MNEITEAVLAEKIGQLSAEITTLRTVVTLLVFEVGKGKNVSILKGKKAQAMSLIESVDFREMSTGEVRFTVRHRDKEKKS